MVCQKRLATRISNNKYLGASLFWSLVYMGFENLLFLANLTRISIFLKTLSKQWVFPAFFGLKKAE